VKQLQDNRAALRTAVQANDLNQIQTLSTQQGTLQGQLAAVRAEGMAKFYASLTPEQRSKVQLRESRNQQRQE
jgi:Spy/CpxP family protein refolding chaperone